jgi:hypothetical protein
MGGCSQSDSINIINGAFVNPCAPLARPQFFKTSRNEKVGTTTQAGKSQKL